MSTDNSELDSEEDTCKRASRGGNRVGIIDLDMKYPSVQCQNKHREQHEEECKKLLAEVRDRCLFKKPESSHLGECPICFLPLSIDASKSNMMVCCSKLICNGCHRANQKREIEAGLEKRCALCREPVSKSQKESHKRIMKRIKENDPVAMREMGKMRYHEGDYDNAFAYFMKAAELGDADAHYGVSHMYRKGQGVEKDDEQRLYHLEEAAIRGEPTARNSLGAVEAKHGRFERAVKHFIIAANLGCHGSLSNLKILYANGIASKEDYADALRAYQAAVEATKSSERKKAEEAIKNGDWMFKIHWPDLDCLKK